jgi:hypothetical protein
MTKSLLQQVMIKQEKASVHPIDVAGLTEKIWSRRMSKILVPSLRWPKLSR